MKLFLFALLSQLNYSSIDQFHLAKEYRTANGFGNSLVHPFQSMSWWPFHRKSKQCSVRPLDPKRVSYEIMSSPYLLKQDRSQISNAFFVFMLQDLQWLQKVDNMVLNGVSGWLDLGQIYEQHSIRMKKQGLLIVDPKYGKIDPKNYQGDTRSRATVEAFVMKGLFVLNHNWHAYQLTNIFPDLNDEQLYQEARRRNIAEYQHITFDEFLPATVPIDMGGYQGYDHKASAHTNIEFSVIAARFTHSNLSPYIKRLDYDLREVSDGEIDTSNFSHQPEIYLKKYGIIEIILGLVWTLAEKTDLHYPAQLRSYGPTKKDLAASDLMQVEEFKVSCYNSVRLSYGLEPHKSFMDVNPDPEIWQPLEKMYGHVDNLNTLVGALAEKSFMKGFELGELVSVMITDQMRRVRSADRFWYEREFCIDELREIKQVSMSLLIHRNFDAYNVHPYVFLRPPTYESFFNNFNLDCNYQKDIKVGEYQNYPPIKAHYDGEVCVCEDENAFFLSLYNKCSCLAGFKYDYEKYKCIRDDNFADLYGEYKIYHNFTSYNHGDQYH